MQSVLNLKVPIDYYIDDFYESDEIDGFNDVDLFDEGSEEVIAPLPSNREFDELGSENQIDN